MCGRPPAVRAADVLRGGEQAAYLIAVPLTMRLSREACQVRQPFTVAWSGSMLHVIAPWSHTHGEILAPRMQRKRAFASAPIDPDDNVLGPPMTKPCRVSSLTIAPPWSS